MRYGINRFVADGEVQTGEWNGMKVTFTFGRAKYDPRGMYDLGVSRQPSCILPDQYGKPHEMILRIAGVTYYPTPKGYVQI